MKSFGGLIAAALGLTVVWLAVTGRGRAVAQAFGAINPPKSGTQPGTMPVLTSEQAFAQATTPGLNTLTGGLPNPVIYTPDPGEVSVSNNPFFQRLVAIQRAQQAAGQ